MIDVLNQIEKKLKRFRGWVPDVDPRDVVQATDNTFSELIGFDPLRIPGILSKDFGYSVQYPGPDLLDVNGINVTAHVAVFRGNMVGWSITANGQSKIIATYVSPTQVTVTIAFNPNFADSSYVLMPDITILGHQSFIISDLLQEYTVIWGVTAGQLRVFISPFYNGSVQPGWMELTEALLTLAVSDVIDSKNLKVIVASQYPTNYFVGWTLLGVNGKTAYVTASVQTQTGPFKQQFTVSEAIVSYASQRLAPVSDIQAGQWVVATQQYVATTNLWDKVNEEPSNDVNPGGIVLPQNGTSANYAEVKLANLTQTVFVTGKTRVTVRALQNGGRGGSLIVDLMEGGTLRGTTTVVLGHDRSTTSATAYFEVDNSTIGNFNDLRVRLRGTTNSLQSILVTYVTATVETTTSLTTTTLNAYRFPLAINELALWQGSGATPTVIASKGKNKLLIPWQNSSGVRQNPLALVRSNNQFFSDNKGALQRTYNSINFERADLSIDSLARGISVSRSTGVTAFQRIVVVPIVDGYQIGDPIYNAVGTSSTISLIIDWPVLNKRITEFIFFIEWLDSGNVGVEDFDRLFQANIYVNGLSPAGVETLKLNNVQTIWQRTYDDKFSIAVNVLAPVPSLGELPTALTLNQYRGSTHTTGVVKYRYRLQMAKQQQSLVAVDESDDAIRLSYYDSFRIHEDDVFPNVGQDRLGAPTMIFLANEGPLLGLAELNGILYAFKQTALQETSLVTFASRILNIDCVSRRGIKSTSIGIVYVGQNNIYLIPKNGGPIEFLNRDFADTFRAIPIVYKQNAIAQEGRFMDSIIVSLQSKDGSGSSVFTQFIYNTRAEIWWKRQFAVVPNWMSVREDGTLEFTDGKKIFKYPDRATYEDIDTNGARTGQPWEITTQWMTLDDADIMKCLRTIVPVILGSSSPRLVNMQIELYFDRRDNIAGFSPFDTLYVTTVNGLFEPNNGMPVRVPNNFRELKIRIVPKTGEALLLSAGKLDVSELRMYAETSGSRGDH